MHSAKRHAGVNAAPPALAAQFTSMARRRAARWGTGRLHQRPAKCNRCQRNSPDPCGYPLLATAGGSWPAGNLRALIRAARPPLPRCPWRERPEAVAADYREAVPTPAALPVSGRRAQVHHGGGMAWGGMAHRGVRGWTCDRMRRGARTVSKPWLKRDTRPTSIFVLVTFAVIFWFIWRFSRTIC